MKNLNEDFKDFSSSEGSPGSRSVLNRIYDSLPKASPLLSFNKLLAAHLLSSFVVLMSCSQFGVRLFFDGHGLMGLFMKISPTFCLAFCGALYLSCTFGFARSLLSYDEWLLVRKSRGLSVLGISLVTLGVLSVLAHEVNFQSGLIWLVGAYLGGLLVSLRIPRKLIPLRIRK